MCTQGPASVSSLRGASISRRRVVCQTSEIAGGSWVFVRVLKGWAIGRRGGAVRELTGQQCPSSLPVCRIFQFGHSIMGCFRLKKAPRILLSPFLLRKRKKFRLWFCGQRPVNIPPRSHCRRCLLVSLQPSYFPAQIIQQQAGKSGHLVRNKTIKRFEFFEGSEHPSTMLRRPRPRAARNSPPSARAAAAGPLSGALYGGEVLPGRAGPAWRRWWRWPESGPGAPWGWGAGKSPSAPRCWAPESSEWRHSRRGRAGGGGGGPGGVYPGVSPVVPPGEQEASAVPQILSSGNPKAFLSGRRQLGARRTTCSRAVYLSRWYRGHKVVLLHRSSLLAPSSPLSLIWIFPSINCNILFFPPDSSWDAAYERELQTFQDIGDAGEIW